MRDVLTAMIKAHEIQGCIALENSFNKVGLDHVVLVKVASTAVVSQLLGLTREQFGARNRVLQRAFHALATAPQVTIAAEVFPGSKKIFSRGPAISKLSGLKPRRAT